MAGEEVEVERKGEERGEQQGPRRVVREGGGEDEEGDRKRRTGRGRRMNV